MALISRGWHLMRSALCANTGAALQSPGSGAPRGGQGPSSAGPASFPEEGELQRPHLKEALTILPLMGCGGRQFLTRGTGGSFSALE